MKKILVPVDGSENSERALMEAKEYAQCTGGKITILTIVETIVIRPYTTVEYHVMPEDEELENVGQSVLTNSLKLLEDFKGQVSTKLSKGNVADEIIREAEEGDYDLIIIGSRGLGTFSRTILGSISNKVLKHSKKNVFVVK